MSTTNVNFRMDSDLKREVDAVCKDMGLTLTSAFTIFAKKLVNEKRIPFEVSAKPEEPDPGDPFYSASNQKILRESMADMERGNYQIHDIIEVSDND